MGRTTTKTNQQPARPPDMDPPIDPNPFSDRFEDPENPGIPDQIEDFDDLFGPEDDGSADYRIIRKQPAFDGDGNRICGYSGLLPYGQDIEWIRQHLGGGVYLVQKYVAQGGRGKKMVEARTVTIAGAPRAPVSQVTTPSAAPVVAVRNPDQPAAEPVRSKSGLTIEELKEALIMKNLLESTKPPEVNSVLLETILAMLKQQRNPVQELMQSFALLEKIRGGGSASSDDNGNGGGTGLLDLIGKGLDAFSSYVAKVQPVAPERSAVSQDANQNPVQVTQAQGQPATVETSQMNIMETANAAVATIVNAFLENPQFPVEETVNVIRRFVPDEARDAIQSSQKTLASMGILALHEAVESDPETDQKFRLYFDQVFAMFLAQTNQATQKGSSNESAT